MARRAGLVCLCLAAGVPCAEAGFLGGLGGLGSAIGGALGQAKEQGAEMLEKAKETACNVKAKLSAGQANDTMIVGLNEGCQKAADCVPPVVDSKMILDICVSSGLSNIQKNLQTQMSKMIKECMDAITDAPANFEGSLANWTSKSQGTLQSALGQSAVVEADGQVQAGTPQRKFELSAVGRGSFSGSPSIAACTFLTLSALGGLVMTLRRSRSRGVGAAEAATVASNLEGGNSAALD